MKIHAIKDSQYYELSDFTRSLKKEHRKHFFDFIKTANMPMVGHQQFISVTSCEEFAMEVVSKAMEQSEAKDLSSQQIEIWRSILWSVIGPYGLIMPVEDIEAIREKVQKRVSTIS